MTEVTDRYMEIEAHFNFHRAFVDEESERFSTYLDILHGIKDGKIPEGSVEREIARVLALAVDEEFDPWNIDLAEFSRAYIAKLKVSGDVDFLAAGKIILLAWTVLKRQSDATLSRIETGTKEEFFFEDWTPWEFDDYENIDDISYTGRVIDSNDPPIKKAVRFSGKRNVSLFDIVDAFKEAKEEAERRKRMESRKKKLRSEQKIEMRDSAHKEDIEEDIKDVWQRIIDFKGDEMTVYTLSDGTKEDFITVFVTVLFLAKRNMVRIWQDEVSGDVFVEDIMPRDENGNVMEPPEIVVEDAEEMPVEEEKQAIEISV